MVVVAVAVFGVTLLVVDAAGLDGVASVFVTVEAKLLMPGDLAVVPVSPRGVWVPVAVFSDADVVAGAGLLPLDTDVSCVAAAVRPAVDGLIPAVSTAVFGVVVTDVDEFCGRDVDAFTDGSRKHPNRNIQQKSFLSMVGDLPSPRRL